MSPLLEYRIIGRPARSLCPETVAWSILAPGVHLQSQCDPVKWGPNAECTPDQQPDGAPNFRRHHDWCDEMIDKQTRGAIAFLAARACEPSANFGCLDDPDWQDGHAKWAAPSTRR